MLCSALAIAGCGSDEEEPAADATPSAEATPAANEFLPEGCENVEIPAPKEIGELEGADGQAGRLQDLRRDDLDDVR